MVRRVDCPVPCRLSKSVLQRASLTASTGMRSAPSRSITRSGRSPLVVSSVAPRSVSRDRRPVGVREPGHGRAVVDQDVGPPVEQREREAAVVGRRRVGPREHGDPRVLQCRGRVVVGVGGAAHHADVGSRRRELERQRRGLGLEHQHETDAQPLHAAALAELPGDSAGHRHEAGGPVDLVLPLLPERRVADAHRRRLLGQGAVGAAMQLVEGRRRILGGRGLQGSGESCGERVAGAAGRLVGDLAGDEEERLAAGVEQSCDPGAARSGVGERDDGGLALGRVDEEEGTAGAERRRDDGRGEPPPSRTRGPRHRAEAPPCSRRRGRAGRTRPGPPGRRRRPRPGRPSPRGGWRARRRAAWCRGSPRGSARTRGCSRSLSPARRPAPRRCARRPRPRATRRRPRAAPPRGARARARDAAG